MTLNQVNSSDAGSNSIIKLMENTRMAYDKADKADFDKNELAYLHTSIGLSRQYKRELTLGNTLASYTSWTHVQSQTGVSIWKFPVTNFGDDSVNELYCNDIKLVYMGAASSESTPSTFDCVFTSNSKRTGETFINLTTEAGTTVGTPFDIMYTTAYSETLSGFTTTLNLAYLNIIEGTIIVTNSAMTTIYSKTLDYTMDAMAGTITRVSGGDITSGQTVVVSYRAGNTIYIGDSTKFEAINAKLATVGVGTIVSFKYSSGSNWQSFTPTLDSTNGFVNDGNISYTASGLIGWTTTTVNNSGSKYFIKILPKNIPLTAPTVYSIVNADNAATDLLVTSSSDIAQMNYKWCYYNGYIYVSIPNSGTPNGEGIKWITSGSTTINKQNYFIYNDIYTINYKDSSVVADTDIMTLTSLILIDGVAEPTVASGVARVYIDIADGDLKIKFGTTGIVKAIQLVTVGDAIFTVEPEA